MGQQPLIGEVLLIIEASRSHSDTTQSAGILWMNDQPDGKTSVRLNTTLTRDRHPCTWRDSKPQSQSASCRRPKPRTARSLGLATTVITRYIHSALTQRAWDQHAFCQNGN